ncbi:extracellular solute-binding protein [Arthrobacter sp. UYEF3]|uniref:extracellular solute-binding protein n=1 Tax=Arthrobacter sp. UYEF3 TaxID=1756365 RepID=UPI0033997BFA
MKKSLRTGALASIAAAGMLLSACGFGGSGGNAGAGESTINLLVPSYADGTKGRWEGIIKDFEAKNPGTKVNLEVQSWDNINDVVKTKIQGKQAPDILNIDAFAGFAKDQLLYPAKDVLSESTAKDFQDKFAQNASIDGTQYGLPILASARALFYNKDLFAKAGISAPPKTWAELEADAKKITDTGTPGYGLPLGAEEAQAETGIWFYGAGGGYGDAKKITVNTPENLEGANFMKKLVDEKVTQANAGATNRTPLINVFIQGQLGMIEALPPTVGQIKEKNPALKYGVAPIPTKDGSPFTLGVADHLMAFKNDGKKQDAIKKFLDYFYSTDVYPKWVAAEGFLPTTKSGAEKLASDPDTKPFLDLLPNARFYPSTNKAWTATQGAVKSLIGQIAQGTDPAAVLKDIQTKADAAS